MPLPQPGKVQKFDTGITLSSFNDLEYGTTAASGYRFLYNGSQFCLSEYNTSTHYREMNVWGNDGTPAMNFVFEKPYILDTFYDSQDEVYYGVRWNDEPEFRVGVSSYPDYQEGPYTATVVFQDQFSSSESWQTTSLPKVVGQESVWTDYLFRNIIQYGDINSSECGAPSFVDFPFSSFFDEDTYNETWPEYHTSACVASTSTFDKYSHPQNKSLDLLHLNTDSGTLDFKSNIGVGYFGFDVEIEGDFVAFVDLDLTTLSSGSSISLRAIESSYAGNEIGAVTLYNDGSDNRCDSWFFEYTNFLYQEVFNTRFSEMYLALPPDVFDTSIYVNTTETHVINVSTASSYGSVTFVGASTWYDQVEDHPAGTLGYFPLDIHPVTLYRWEVVCAGDAGPCFPSFSPYQVDYLSGGFLNVVDGGREGMNTYIDFGTGEVLEDATIGDVFGHRIIGFDYKYPNTGVTQSSGYISLKRDTSTTAVSTIRLAIKRVNDRLYFMQGDYTSPGSFTVINAEGFEYSGGLKFELYADARASEATPEIFISQFVVRDLLSYEGSQGTTRATFPYPVFSVETFDKDGKRVEVPGVSDSSGFVIPKLGLIDSIIDSGGNWDDYLGKVQIATNHGSTTSSGEVFINIGQDFYKYLKSDLPITVHEDGALASVVASGTLFGSPNRSANTLDWNGYTEGGLIYVADNSADPGDGLYLNVIRHTTMGPNDPVKFAWIDESSDSSVHPVFYGVDANEPHLLYGLSLSDYKVYLYNLDEDASAFCNVVSQKQIVGANTAEISEVTAQVVNIYGDPLQFKTVNFFVSSGDGSIAPASDTTDSIGEAQTTYTVGSTVGTTSITATVVD